MADLANDDATDEDPVRRGPREEQIRQALIRLEAAVQRRADLGRSSVRSTTTLVEGLRCVSREGNHTVASDLGPALGGDDSGPTPSALLRVALGSCLTMGYRLRAARHGIPIESIRVEVEMESAVGGMLDPDSPFPPGCIEVRYRVEIESPAPVDAIERIVDEADRFSPVLDAVIRPNRVIRLDPAAAPGEEGS